MKTFSTKENSVTTLLRDRLASGSLEISVEIVSLMTQIHAAYSLHLVKTFDKTADNHPINDHS